MNTFIFFFFTKWPKFPAVVMHRILVFHWFFSSEHGLVGLCVTCLYKRFCIIMWNADITNNCPTSNLLDSLPNQHDVLKALSGSRLMSHLPWVMLLSQAVWLIVTFSYCTCYCDAKLTSQRDCFSMLVGAGSAIHFTPNVTLCHLLWQLWGSFR